MPNWVREYSCESCGDAMEDIFEGIDLVTKDAPKEWEMFTGSVRITIEYIPEVL